MPEDLGKAVLELEADDGRFSRSFASAEKTSKGFVARASSRLSHLGKVAVLAAGAAGVAALTIGLKAGIDEYRDSAKVAAQTNAVIASTGGAAHVTARHVDTLATALLNKSGIDDETVKSGENMLLTFRDIRNEVGQGNDIFDQATRAVTDMDTAMTGGNVTAESMRKTSIMVGKALQDPIKGVTTLRRGGVQLNDQQAKMVQAFVDSGQKMKAQKIILGELNKEFGGSAKAMGDTIPGKVNILKESIRNLLGDAVAKMAPAFSRAVDWISVHLPDIERVVGKVMHGVGTAIRTAAHYAREFSNAVGGWENAAKLIVSGVLAAKLAGVGMKARGAYAAVRALGGASGLLSFAPGGLIAVGLAGSIVSLGLLIDAIRRLKAERDKLLQPKQLASRHGDVKAQAQALLARGFNPRAAAQALYLQWLRTWNLTFKGEPSSQEKEALMRRIAGIVHVAKRQFDALPRAIRKRPLTVRIQTHAPKAALDAYRSELGRVEKAAHGNTVAHEHLKAASKRYQDALSRLQSVQDAVKGGSLKGAAADDKLRDAKQRVVNTSKQVKTASQNAKQAQQELASETKVAASMYDRLAASARTAKSHIDSVGDAVRRLPDHKDIHINVYTHHYGGGGGVNDAGGGSPSAPGTTPLFLPSSATPTGKPAGVAGGANGDIIIVMNGREIARVTEPEIQRSRRRNGPVIVRAGMA